VHARHRLDRHRRRPAVQPERLNHPERAVRGEAARERQRVEAAAVQITVEEEERRAFAAVAQAHERCPGTPPASLAISASDRPSIVGLV